MNSLLLLIPLSILFLVGAGVALFWAVDHGQFDETDTAALLPVVDADRASTEAASVEEPVKSPDEPRRSR